MLGQEISTDYSNYASEEEIIVTFSDGPGNPKDWVGLYKQEMVAGEDSSLAWAYVDGTETGTEGLAEGELTFTDGLTDEASTRRGFSRTTVIRCWPRWFSPWATWGPPCLLYTSDAADE